MDRCAWRGHKLLAKGSGVILSDMGFWVLGVGFALFRPQHPTPITYNLGFSFGTNNPNNANAAPAILSQPKRS
jgi:hypothetical protein